MPLPLTEKQAGTAVRWLVTHFRGPMERPVEGTPFTLELLCGIACQETAFLWLPFVAKQISAAEANASRALRAMGPKQWVYKGTGSFSTTCSTSAPTKRSSVSGTCEQTGDDAGRPATTSRAPYALLE